MKRLRRRSDLLVSALLLPAALAGCATAPPPPDDPGQIQTLVTRIHDPAEAATVWLLSLMGERLALMTPVAQSKWNTRAPVEDAPREAALVAAAVQEGLARGLPAALTERFFRAQIEAAKHVQREHFAAWEAAGQKPFPRPRSLQRDLRPKLDALTKDLLDALAAVRPQLGGEKSRAALARHSPALLGQAGVSECAAALALEPLRSP